MNLQNESSIPLPDEIQEALENGRNKVTILEAETQRLAKLKASMTKEIVSQEAKLEDIRLTNEKELANLDSTKNLIVNGNLLLDQLREDQSKIESEIKEQNTAIEKRQKGVDSQAKQNEIKEEQLMVREQELVTAENELDKNQVEFNKKISILDKALSEIK